MVSTPSSDDEDRTVTRPPETGGEALPVGHRLQEFVIEGLIGEGGFSIVYEARDTRLERSIALKEYMPASLASRGAGRAVCARSERCRETFELGLRSFVNEARILASFEHPSLVKVYRFWEENGTAYMVMPCYRGPTLRKWLLECGAPPDESWLRALLSPLVDALELIHGDHCYHRDIATDNIILLATLGGDVGDARGLRPVLLDFGAARRVIGDATQALTVILKPGYAPIEQYAAAGAMHQGPWTDIYALCAVLYTTVAGHTPVPSVGRMLDDQLVPAVQAGQGRYSQAFLAAIDAGLAIRPQHRPQSMAQLRAMFDASASTTPSPQAPPAPPPQVSAPFPQAPPTFLPQAPSVPGLPMPVRRLRATAWAAVATAVLGLAGAGAWWATRGVRPATLAAAPTPTVIAVGPAPVSPPPVPRPFSVLAAVQDMVAHGQPAPHVVATTDKPALTIGSEDRLSFKVRSSEAGYLYVFFAGTGKADLQLLFPNKVDSNNRIPANQDIVLPRKGWNIFAGGPPGVDHVAVVVSRSPRDLESAGLRYPPGSSIGEFDVEIAGRQWERSAERATPLLGKTLCKPAQDCSDGYGAALLEVSEVAAPSAAR